MASQLAAARAATEAANNQLIIVQGESAGRLKELETASSNESAKVQVQQVAECERQLQAEVEVADAAEASAATLRRAAQREAELEQQLQSAEGAAAMARPSRRRMPSRRHGRAPARGGREAEEAAAARRLEITAAAGARAAELALRTRGGGRGRAGPGTNWRARRQAGGRYGGQGVRAGRVATEHRELVAARGARRDAALKLVDTRDRARRSRPRRRQRHCRPSRQG